MTNWKKAGLTALAGSLVASSAFAGAVTVSGTANTDSDVGINWMDFKTSGWLLSWTRWLNYL